jgi:hypothetical protein
MNLHGLEASYGATASRNDAGFEGAGLACDPETAIGSARP